MVSPSGSIYCSVFRPGLFAGRRILVTGGGSGIGRCIAHELASLGAHVALLGRTADKLAAVAAEIADAGGIYPSTHICDIRDEIQVKSAVAAVVEAGTPIHGLVNNAGGQFRSPLKDISGNGFDAVVRNNLTGGFLMSREVFRQSMEQHGGSIVNIIANMWQSMPGMGHSGAARAGMLNLTQTAAVEWAYAGVRVNAVAPGAIASSGLNTYSEEFRPVMRTLLDWLPGKRFGTESEISAPVVFLLSPAAAFISGSCIRVDGAEPNRRFDWPAPDHDRSQPYRGFALESKVDFLQSTHSG
jgi:citronellol/citronellal dehydrogenase